LLILQPTHLILHEEENLIKYAKRGCRTSDSLL